MLLLEMMKMKKKGKKIIELNFSKKENKLFLLLSEQLVDQVLSELNITMANQMPGKLT